MAKPSDVPEEIQDEYYEPERRERTGVAWLLALGTLVVTVLLAAGIFFAGRWTYRQLADNGNGTQDAPSTTQREPAQEADEQQPADEAQDDGGGQDAERAPADQPADGQANEGDEAEAPADDQQNGAVAGDTTDRDDLPSTGPESSLAIFVAVTVLGYVLHRVYART